ncbi:hypothetical protein WK17_21200 [Burkholderia multivorans]|nr:hypothetical protein WK17_21200 [Burkholderia multivorans]
MQFNIGLETIDGGTFVRHGVAFSLEPSQTLPSIDVLVPKVGLFNDFLRSSFDAPLDFRMWYYKGGQRFEIGFPTAITPDLIETGVFIFLGAAQPIDHIDDDKILSDFDLLMPLYLFVESNGSRLPHQDSPASFAFRAGNNEKKSTAVATIAERQLSIALRHNELQKALYRQLCAEFGADNVGTEVGSGSGGRIDAVVRTADGYTFYEIKVGLSLQSSVREAVGQLLEYSYWPGSQRAHSLVIVGEAQLDKQGHVYLESLRRNLNIPITYKRIVASPSESSADSIRDTSGGDSTVYKAVASETIMDAEP